MKSVYLKMKCPKKPLDKLFVICFCFMGYSLKIYEVSVCCTRGRSGAFYSGAGNAGANTDEGR